MFFTTLIWFRIVYKSWFCIHFDFKDYFTQSIQLKRSILKGKFDTTLAKPQILKIITSSALCRRKIVTSYLEALPIQPVYRRNGPNGLNWRCCLAVNTDIKRVKIGTYQNCHTRIQIITINFILSLPTFFMAITLCGKCPSYCSFRYELKMKKPIVFFYQSWYIYIVSYGWWVNVVYWAGAFHVNCPGNQPLVNVLFIAIFFILCQCFFLFMIYV